MPAHLVHPPAFLPTVEISVHRVQGSVHGVQENLTAATSALCAGKPPSQSIGDHVLAR